MSVLATTPSQTTNTLSEGHGSGGGRIVAVLSFTGIVAAGMQSLIIPLLSQLATLLHTTASTASWTVTITPLTAAIAIPVAGRLGDMWGKKRLILISAIPLVVGSVMCALATSAVMMIIGRGLEGFGMGVLPLGIALMREVIPPEKLASAVATMSASMGIGGALGLPFAAVIAQTTNWRIMFWVFAGLCAACLLLVWRLVPAGLRGDPSARFDLLGAILLGGGLVGLLLYLSKGADWGWGDPLALGCVSGGVILTVIWAVWQFRAAQPLANLRTLRDRTVALTNLASIFVSFAMYAQTLIVPQLLQLSTATGYGLGKSMLGMALWYAPGGLAMMVGSPVGARVTRARGPKTTLVAAALIMAAAYAVTPSLMSTAWGLMLSAIICNVGVGCALGVIPILIMPRVPMHETAAANSLNTLLRDIGTSSAAAFLGFIIAAFTVNIGGQIAPSLTGFHTAIWVGCAASLAAAITAAFLPNARSAATGGAPTSDGDNCAASVPFGNGREDLTKQGIGE